jgi:hypothetical protein
MEEWGKYVRNEKGMNESTCHILAFSDTGELT